MVKQSNANGRVATLSLEELAEVAKPIVEKYPDLSQNPLKSAHLNRIIHDFPDFKDEKSVRENSDVVVRYYNGLMKNELKPATEERLKGGAGARIGFGSLNDLEWQHLQNNASMISRYAYASTKAMSESSARYGSAPGAGGSSGAQDGYPGNAFQHAVWSCLIIREAMMIGYSKNQAIYFTRNITSDHECDNNGNRLYSNHTAMDLHNNLSARSWFNAHYGGGVWPVSLNIPSEGDIFNYWQESEQIRSFSVCNAAITLPAQFGGWEYLYGTAVGLMHNRLYYILPVPAGCPQ
ncbi:hypothetical protein GCM10028817_19450 [Spirosoma pomorum]